MEDNQRVERAKTKSQKGSVGRHISLGGLRSQDEVIVRRTVQQYLPVGRDWALVGGCGHTKSRQI